MSRKRSTAEKIIGMLREAEVSLAQGNKAGDVCRSLDASEQRGQMNECRVQSARKRRGFPITLASLRASWSTRTLPRPWIHGSRRNASAVLPAPIRRSGTVPGDFASGTRLRKTRVHST